MKRPFVYISIPVLIGIVFFYFVDISLSMILALIITTILLSLIHYRKNRINVSGIILLFVLLGIFLAYIKLNSSELLKHKGEILQMEGIVEDIRYIENNKGRTFVNIKNIKGKNFNKNISEKMRITIIGNVEIEIYDTIIFNAEIVEPLGNTNPNCIIIS